MRRPRIIPAALLSSLTLSVLSSCADRTEDASQATPTPPADAPATSQGSAPNADQPPEAPTAGETYTGVRGVVMSLPDPARPQSDLRIRHEHIPTFRGRDGVININRDGSSGMRAMEMPFPVAPELDISDLRVGDIIEFDFLVTWGTPPYALTRYEKLDPGTELDFSNKPSVTDDDAGTDGP